MDDEEFMYENQDEYEEDFIDEEIEDEDEVEEEGEEIEKESEIITDDFKLSENANKTKITSKFLTKYERTKVLGARALQISLGSPPMVDIGDETEPYNIALLEIRQQVLPYIVRRFLPNGTFEEWKVKDLISLEDIE